MIMLNEIKLFRYFKKLSPDCLMKVLGDTHMFAQSIVGSMIREEKSYWK